jgi:hypothetical protein
MRLSVGKMSPFTEMKPCEWGRLVYVGYVQGRMDCPNEARMCVVVTEDGTACNLCVQHCDSLIYYWRKSARSPHEDSHVRYKTLLRLNGESVN